MEIGSDGMHREIVIGAWEFDGNVTKDIERYILPTFPGLKRFDTPNLKFGRIDEWSADIETFQWWCYKKQMYTSVRDLVQGMIRSVNPEEYDAFHQLANSITDKGLYPPT